MPAETLARLARRVSEPDYEPRRAVLDIAAELMAVEPDADRLPPRLRDELLELLADVRAVQPEYPSRRETSPLFDRRGLGRPARERAARIVRRLVALSDATERIGRE